MSQKRFLCVADFDTNLHYKDKNPIWIKLYCSILDDYDFAQIADETKFHAVGLMLLASRLNNKFPDDERWLRRKINANSKINVQLLLEIGFLEVVKGSRSNPKKSFNARKSNKTQGDSARAVLESSKKTSSPEQNRTEENKTEHNTTEHAAVPCVGVDFGFGISASGLKTATADTKSEIRNHKSQFSLEECLRYVEICKEKGEDIKNPKGLANHIYKTGEADAFITAALFPEKQTEIDRKKYGEPRQFTENPCTVCFGAKMANTDGKGFRKCTHCRDEKGKATGCEPDG